MTAKKQEIGSDQSPQGLSKKKRDEIRKIKKGTSHGVERRR